MNAATITQDRARELAYLTLSHARRDFHRGRYDDFAQGGAFGELRIIWIHMELDNWIYEGIRNELRFLMYEAGKRRYA